MENTATRANKEKNTRTVTFKSEEHEKFYQKYLPRCRYQDEYHKALVYCLDGLETLCRKQHLWHTVKAILLCFYPTEIFMIRAGFYLLCSIVTVAGWGTGKIAGRQK